MIYFKSYLNLCINHQPDSEHLPFHNCDLQCALQCALHCALQSPPSTASPSASGELLYPPPKSHPLLLLLGLPSGPP